VEERRLEFLFEAACTARAKDNGPTFNSHMVIVCSAAEGRKMSILRTIKCMRPSQVCGELALGSCVTHIFSLFDPNCYKWGSQRSAKSSIKVLPFWKAQNNDIWKLLIAFQSPFLFLGRTFMSKVYTGTKTKKNKNNKLFLDIKFSQQAFHFLDFLFNYLLKTEPNFLP
jgi:hypothetical protein